MINIFKIFKKIKAKYGESSITRVEQMLESNVERHPLQEGAKLILPGLSNEPWLNAYDFPDLQRVIEKIELKHEGIKKEVNEIICAGSHLNTRYKHYLGEQKDWSAIYLFKDGVPNLEAKPALPISWSIYENELKDFHCPLLEVHFSILHPGAVIKPHCDLWNFTINLHLAIDIPDDCSITVANEQRNWEEGKCLLFDYSYLHEARNLSGADRVCMLVDVWHPNVSLAEREALTYVVKELRSFMNVK